MQTVTTKSYLFQRLRCAFTTCLLTVAVLAASGCPRINQQTGQPTAAMPAASGSGDGVAYAAAQNSLSAAAAANLAATQQLLATQPGTSCTLPYGTQGTIQADGSCAADLVMSTSTITIMPNTTSGKISLGAVGSACLYSPNGSVAGTGTRQADGSCLPDYKTCFLEPSGLPLACTAQFMSNCTTSTDLYGVKQADGSCLATLANPKYIVQTNVEGGLEPVLLVNRPPSSTQTPMPSYGMADVRPASATVATAMRSYESNAVETVRQLHNLPTSDAAIILDSARNEVRANVYAQLLNVANKTQWTAAEKAVMDFYAERIRLRRAAAASFSQYQYNLFETNICLGSSPGKGWAPPAGFPAFDYTQTRQACLAGGRTAGMAAGGTTPNPPSFDDFKSYGVRYAYSDLSTDAQMAITAAGTASGIIYGATASAGGAVGAGIGGSLVYSIAGLTVSQFGESAFLSAVAPLAATNAEIEGLALGMKASDIVIGVGDAASAVAAPLLIVTAALVTIIEEGIMVFSNADLPKQLQGNVDAARSAPNMHDLVKSTQGIQEFYGIFIASTMPDFANTLVPPAASSADPQFLVLDEHRNPLKVTPSIDLKSTLAASLPSLTASLNGGWFVQTSGGAPGGSVNPVRHYATAIPYVDWSNNKMMAWRFGNTFIRTNGKDMTAGVSSNEFQYLDPNGNKLIASIAVDSARRSLPSR